MYEPKPLREPAGSIAADLAERALNRQLTIYAGAGLSAADPTSLPGASRLAQRVWDALSSQIPLDGVDPTDLIAVAGAVAAQPMGSDLLRQTILRVADFCGADFNYAHEVVALLLCEGAATVIETNYDDCIERAAHPERPVVVRTSAEMLDALGAALLKAHGCATQPRTMIVTQAELDAVPSWAQTRVASQLRSSRVAFVGIGSPADYVRDSIQDLATEVGLDHVVVVDPSLAGWEGSGPSAWRDILPDLSSAQRDTRTAEDFLDAVLRAYLHRPRQSARDAVSGMPIDHPQRRGLELLLAAIEERDAVWVLRWMRAASHRRAPGDAVGSSDLLIKGLLGVGSLLANSTVSKIRSGGWIAVCEEEPASATQPVEESSIEESHPTSAANDSSTSVMLLMAHGPVLGSVAEAEARHRVIRARGDDVVPAGANVVVVVVGHMGPMSGEILARRGDRLKELLARQLESLVESPPNNLVSSSGPEHLIDGVNSGSIILVNGDGLIEAA